MDAAAERFTKLLTTAGTSRFALAALAHKAARTNNIFLFGKNPLSLLSLIGEVGIASWVRNRKVFF